MLWSAKLFDKYEWHLFHAVEKKYVNSFRNDNILSNFTLRDLLFVSHMWLKWNGKMMKRNCVEIWICMLLLNGFVCFMDFDSSQLLVNRLELMSSSTNNSNTYIFCCWRMNWKNIMNENKVNFKKRENGKRNRKNFWIKRLSMNYLWWMSSNCVCSIRSTFMCLCSPGHVYLINSIEIFHYFSFLPFASFEPFDCSTYNFFFFFFSFYNDWLTTISK